MTEKAKRSVSELLRLACIYAEQDRIGMAHCDGGEEGKKAAQLAKEIRAYRLKRWGRTALESDLDGAYSIDIKDILNGPRT